MQDALIGWKPMANDPRTPSSRIRCLAPLAYLQKQGLPVELFDPRKQQNYRVVVLQKCYEPEHLKLASSLQQRGTRVVFDLCDNHFYNPDNDPGRRKRIAWLTEMLDRADLVTVSTEELARRLPRPAIVVRDGIVPPDAPGAIDRLLAFWAQRGRRQPIELVWYGVPTSALAPTGIPELRGIAGVLDDLSRDVPLRLTVISSSRRMFGQYIKPLNIETRYIDWGNYERFCCIFPFFDICVMPITRNPVTVCKTNNRLALSLYLGVPVIADSIPSYQEFSSYCMLDDWHEGLRRYIASLDLRRQHAEMGRTYVLRHHMVEHAAAEWWSLFDALLKEREVPALRAESDR